MFPQDKFKRVTSRCISALHSCHHKISGSSPKARIVGASALFLAAFTIGAAGFAPAEPDMKDAPVNPISKELALPDLQQQISALEENAQYYVNEEKVRTGDTLATLLNRLGVDDEDAANFIKSDTLARSVMQLRAGKRVVAQTDENGELVRLSAMLDDGSDTLRNLVISREGDHFKADAVPATLERRVEMRSGIIFSSLFAATDTAQIPDAVALQLVDMFATNINFAADLRRGDRFNVVYETFWQNGEPVRTGRVLAGEFDNAGNRYQAVWFNDPGNKGGGGGYYAFDGKSLKKAFLKSPLAFTRISSGFSMRLHPILGKWKQHTGVDFAAPTGTPIHAAADGVVDFVGQQNGYGNIVVIKHWSGYSTAYGHMSRFAAGIKKGMKISQSDVIGYVGMTGWATGPHLHYEFRVNNQPRNPLSVDVPNNQALTGPQLKNFRTVAAEMQHRMAMLRVPGAPDVKLASK
ncbi:M23 family metallopeptidase [Herbaspirillum chlorophenolicum]|uniref:M23 family metallopeptidase n=1 Tax=Herbaspirillum chlorophenolicum TaxID=211589 RepID=A0ABW8EVU1_9BURK